MSAGIVLIVLGVVAVSGAFWLGPMVAARRLVRESPHHEESSRICRIIELAAERPETGTTVVRAALDDLLALARRYPAEPIVQADFFGAAAGAMRAIPGAVTPEQLDAFAAHAGAAIDASPGRWLAGAIAVFLEALHTSRPHADVARALRDRLGRQWPAFRR